MLLITKKREARLLTYLAVPIALTYKRGSPSVSAATSSLGQIWVVGESTRPRAWREVARRDMTVHQGERWAIAKW